MPVDLKLYWNSFSPVLTWKAIFLFMISFLLFSLSVDLIKGYVVEYGLSRFPVNIASDILCIIFFVYVWTKIAASISNKLLPGLNSVVLVGLCFVFYFMLIRFRSDFQFYHLQIPYLTWIKYADLLFILSCALLLEFRSYNRALTKKSFLSLISDEPDPDSLPDLIDNESFVKRIALTINETTGKRSFAIGVFSSWGMGKTDFLLRLKKTLIAHNGENIVLEFNPWKAASLEGVIEDFFSVLAHGLKPYNRTIGTKLKAYSKKILSPGKEIQYRIADTLIEEFVKEPSLQERYDTVNKTITQTGKRLVIFIDDLDRLAGSEVMQVLRVVRNSANFSNTFFIVAMDHDYIVSVMNKTGFISKEEQYLKKIFQLTVTLPIINKGSFREELENILISKESDEEDRDKINKTLSVLTYRQSQFIGFGPPPIKEEGSLEKMLSNYRDIKRFANSFKIAFNVLKEEVEIIDLFLLELIKSKSLNAYEQIASKALLKRGDDSPHNFELDGSGWESFKRFSRLDESDVEDIKSVIDHLLDDSKSKNQRKFAYPHNFYLYFSYQLFSLISLKSFQEAIKLPFQEMRVKFDQWILDGKDLDLDRILDSYQEYSSAVEFERFLRGFLLSSDKFDFLSRAKKMVMGDGYKLATLFGSEEDYNSFLRRTLNDDSLPEYTRSILANELLKFSIYNQKDLYLSKQELQDVIYKLFDRFLLNHVGFDQTVNSFYLLNDDNRSDNRIILNSKAHKRLQEFLLIPGNIDGFIKYLIRSRSIPTDGEFVFAPFTRNIFKNLQTFKKIIEEYVPSDENAEKLRSIILAQTDEYIAGKDRFKLDGDDLTFIIKHLQNTGQYPSVSQGSLASSF